MRTLIVKLIWSFDEVGLSMVSWFQMQESRKESKSFQSDDMLFSFILRACIHHETSKTSK